MPAEQEMDRNLEVSDWPVVRVAVIVPAYGQASLTAEAIRSALNQRTDFAYAIVVVNDGCPDDATREICLTFATANPGRIFYLQKSNGGLSAARNTGIDFALMAFPQLEGVYFLDCDNRIGPHLLQRLMTALRAGDDRIGWAYVDVDKFGFAEFGDTSGPYAPLEHLFRNISEAGSMAGRRMLDAGIRFDTEMRRGVEDWEFWLQGLEMGFRGVHVPDAGFRYRRRGESMLVAAERDFEPILEYIRSRHPALFRPEALLAREIDGKTRYAVYHPDTQRVSRLTASAERDFLDRDDYLRLLLRSFERPDYGQCPGHLVVMNESVFDALAGRRMLAGLLWILECAVRRATFAAITFCPTANSSSSPRWLCEDFLVDYAATTTFSLPSEAHIIALEAGVLLSRARAGGGFDGLLHQVGKSSKGLVLTADIPDLPTSGQGAADALEALCEALAGVSLREHAQLWRAAPLARYRAQPAMPRDIYAHVGLPSVFPCVVLANQKHRVALVVEPGTPGALAAAERMCDLLCRRGWSVHLVILGDAIEADTGALQNYAEIVQLPLSALRVSAAADHRIYNGTVIPRLDGYQLQDAIATLAAFQLVVSVTSSLANTLMGSLRRLKIETCCLLQLDDPNRSPAELINACAAFEQAYNSIIVENRSMLHLCRALGIPQKKLYLWHDLTAALNSGAPMPRTTTETEAFRA